MVPSGGFPNIPHYPVLFSAHFASKSPRKLDTILSTLKNVGVKVRLWGLWWAGHLGTRSALMPQLLPTIQSQIPKVLGSGQVGLWSRVLAEAVGQGAAGQTMVQAQSRGLFLL